MIHSLQIEKTMTKTVVVKRKAKRHYCKAYVAAYRFAAHLPGGVDCDNGG